MKFKKYINEAKMGKLPGKIERIASMTYPAMLKWRLSNPDVNDDRVNITTIENLAWKELTQMRNKKILDFDDFRFNVWGPITNPTKSDEYEFEADVILASYDEKKLKAELRKLKFKTK